MIRQYFQREIFDGGLTIHLGGERGDENRENNKKKLYCRVPGNEHAKFHINPTIFKK